MKRILRVGQKWIKNTKQKQKEINRNTIDIKEVKETKRKT